jgi:DNA-binding winged helix-turn-helix (wHTH) protein/tetratricopeptide (TPR) repeat protein
MQQHASEGRILRFGSYEVDLLEGSLTKAGFRVRLQGQPFQILALLLEHAGQTVTREEIRQKLWSDKTFVEFDDALNTAVRKLRAALGDTADNPKFLETVPRRGYRFVAPVTVPSESQTLDDPVQSTLVEVPLAQTSTAEVEPSPPHGTFGKAGIPRYALFLLTALVLAMAIGTYFHLRRPAFRITTEDMIVVADFVNTTGQSVFDDALRQGLEIGLQQSPSVKVLSDRKASVILKQMGHLPDERMTGKTAIEVCQRASGKVAVQGSIASLGRAYLIGLAAIRCDSGDPIANEQVQAKREEDVLDALGRATAQLRSRLGESLPSIRKYNAPLEQATTASLDALNTYGLALSTWDKKGDRDSLPLFKKATELDPNFAQAYGGLATIYHNLGDADLARKNAAKAYELRTQVTLAEKANIEARYYSYVTGELEKAREVRALEVQNYPDSAGAYNHLGNIDGALGRYEEAVQDLRKALLLDPTRASTYSNLANALLGLNQIEDAAAVLADANKRKLQTESLLLADYWIAFLRNDNTTMQSLLQQSSSTPGGQSTLLSEQSNTEAYYGHFAKSRELSRTASNLMEHEGETESAANGMAQTALWEAEIGNSANARKLISQAQKMSLGQDVTTLAALSLARLGDLKQAEALSLQLSKQWPLGTYVQRYWLPVIHAEIDLRKGQPLKALEDLNAATSPLEFSSPLTLPVATLYPAYVRGQAYLANGDYPGAINEFQKLSDHRGIEVNDPLVPLARVGLARAYAHTGDLLNARKAYQNFLELWKDADPDIPILRESKVEYVKLQ